MIRINLLPPAERQPDWPLNRLFAIIGSALAIILLLVYCSTVFMIWQKERQLTEERNQYELLRPTEVAMKTAVTKQQTISAKNAILVNLTNERKSWPPLITHLAMLTTPRIWFTELGAVNKDAIKIVGLADNYQEIATFLQRLEQDGIFAEPSLVQAEIMSDNKATKFEITVKLKGIKQ